MMINIVKGSDKTINLAFTQNGSAWTLAGATQITVILPARTNLSKTLTGGAITVTNEAGGLAELVLTDTETATMKSGLAQSIEVVVDKGTVKTVFQLRDILNVTDRLFA